MTPYLCDESSISSVSLLSRRRGITSRMLSYNRRTNDLYSKSSDDVSPKLKSATSTENLNEMQTRKNSIVKKKSIVLGIDWLIRSFIDVNSIITNNFNKNHHLHFWFVNFTLFQRLSKFKLIQLTSDHNCLPISRLDVVCHTEYDGDNSTQYERNGHYNDRQLRLLLHFVRIDCYDFRMICDLISHVE